MKRGGFTLLEVVVALTVTGVVALLAYGTLQAGVDTQERVGRAQAVISTDAVLRSVAMDALRHLPEGGGAAMDELLFALDDRTDAAGVPSDVVTFLSLGIGRAPGTAGVWSVTLAPAEPGVRLRAAPLDPTEGAPFELLVSGARGLDAHVLARSAETVWLDRWDVPGRVPAAVHVQLLDASGRPLGPALVAHTALEEVP